MKIVKGKLYSLTIDKYTFPVITTDSNRALHFFQEVFPDQNVKDKDVLHVETFFSRYTLAERFTQIKQIWNEMGLLQAAPGSIKFNKNALDLLLANTEFILTNT